MAATVARQIRVLLIEDNPGDARLIQLMLDEAGAQHCRVETAARLSDGLSRLEEASFDVVLLDLSLPDAHGLETFLRAQTQAPTMPIVVLSGLDDEALAVRAVQAGAQDYLVKGHVDGELLLRAMRYAMERKRLEQERRALERQKDEFLANVSHDLRTPLAGIKASIGVVLANEPAGTPEPLHRMFVNIDRAADRMSSLVENLLELARLQAGRAQLRVLRHDLNALAKRAAAAVEPLAQERGQRVELIVPHEPLVAEVDPDRLERALVNLLTNAHKYGRAGGMIRLSLEPTPRGAHFAVADDGPGIPAADLERIFDRFYRPESDATRRVEGSGLGLSIARAMVELHGGRVWAESEPGEGATFHVALPVRIEDHSDVQSGEDGKAVEVVGRAGGEPASQTRSDQPGTAPCSRPDLLAARERVEGRSGEVTSREPAAFAPSPERQRRSSRATRDRRRLGGSK